VHRSPTVGPRGTEQRKEENMDGMHRRHILKAAAGAAAIGLFNIRTEPARAAEFT
jgi:hypothetical protein